MVPSGPCLPVDVGETVLNYGELWYRVHKLFPADGKVVLQKSNTLKSPFNRFLNKLWFPPPSANDAFPVFLG